LCEKWGFLIKKMGLLDKKESVECQQLLFTPTQNPQKLNFEKGF